MNFLKKHLTSAQCQRSSSIGSFPIAAGIRRGTKTSKENMPSCQLLKSSTAAKFTVNIPLCFAIQKQVQLRFFCWKPEVWVLALKHPLTLTEDKSHGCIVKSLFKEFGTQTIHVTKQPHYTEDEHANSAVEGNASTLEIDFLWAIEQNIQCHILVKYPFDV